MQGNNKESCLTHVNSNNVTSDYESSESPLNSDYTSDNDRMHLIVSIVFQIICNYYKIMLF